MKKEDQLREVANLWPYLPQRIKWRLFFLAFWYARVLAPARRLANRLGLTPLERRLLAWMPVAVLTGFCLYAISRFILTAPINYWSSSIIIAALIGLLLARVEKDG